MTRLVLFLFVVLVLAFGLSWLADRPGSLLITWQGYEIETSVFRAVVLFAALIGLVLLVWSLLRQILSSPAAVNRFLARRRQKRGLDALSAGMIAVGAGDKAMAARYAMQARKTLPHEPLTHLLRAQAAQLSGDKGTARRIFEAMLASPDTEPLGLRGLFLEAGREGEREVQRQFAARAHALNPNLEWPVEALFNLECRAGDWDAALKTLASARRHGHMDRRLADRRRAVLLTAQAQALEEHEPDKALTLAVEAHGLAADLVPAAAIAGRLLASRGNTPRAAKIIQRTWSKAQHPELATAYAYARIGDSPRDRLDRVKQLSALTPFSVEAAVAVATAAIEAREFDEARRTLQPYLEDGLTRRIAVLMARIEREEHGDKGRIREWLARAVHAGRDPAWFADGVVSERWAPVSPVTGALDAFVWRVPPEQIEAGDAGTLGQDLEGLVAIAGGAAPEEGAVDSEAAEVEPTQAPPQDAAARASSETSLPAPEVQEERGGIKVTQSPGRAQMRPPRAETPVPKAATRAPKPQVFTPPHAPDDPGTGAGEESGDAIPPLRPFRA